MWVDQNVASMLDTSSVDRVASKLRAFAGLLSQADSEKDFAWHRLTAGQLQSEQRAAATREFVEAQNKLDRHSASVRTCAARAVLACLAV